MWLLQLHNWYLWMLQNSDNFKSFNLISNKAARVVRVLACLLSVHASWFESSTRPVSILWVFQPCGNFHISNVLMKLLILPANLRKVSQPLLATSGSGQGGVPSGPWRYDGPKTWQMVLDGIKLADCDLIPMPRPLCYWDKKAIGSNWFWSNKYQPK